MTQEQKELLMNDLCARLSYGVKVKVKYYDDDWKLLAIYTNGTTYATRDIGDPIETYFEEVKPYLFPLSSMTEEQKKELFNFCDFFIYEDWEGKKSEVYGIEIASRPDPLRCYDHIFRLWGVDMRAINWLLKNHFDINGLIPMGLANDSTNLNIY